MSYQKKLKQLIKDLINRYKILNGPRYFSAATLQNHLIFLLNKKYFRFFTNSSKVLSWKSIGFSDKNIENATTSDRNFGPTLINYYLLPDTGHCFINNNNDASLGGVNLYFSDTRPMLKIFKHRFYIR